MEEILEPDGIDWREHGVFKEIRKRILKSPSMSEHLDMELELKRQADEMAAEETAAVVYHHKDELCVRCGYRWIEHVGCSGHEFWPSGYRSAPARIVRDWKDTNPKDTVGIQKAPLSTVPMNVMFELGNAMVEGAMKYGRHNYRVVGVRASVYFDAAMRHLAAWWEGEDIDPDSGVSHVTKAMACLVVVRDSMMRNNWVDDRPPKSLPFMEEQNAHTKQLREKYPDPVKPFTQLSLAAETAQGSATSPERPTT